MRRTCFGGRLYTLQQGLRKCQRKNTNKVFDRARRLIRTSLSPRMIERWRFYLRHITNDFQSHSVLMKIFSLLFFCALTASSFSSDRCVFDLNFELRTRKGNRGIDHTWCLLLQREKRRDTSSMKKEKKLRGGEHRRGWMTRRNADNGLENKALVNSHVDGHCN